ncbi:MAG: Dyp-type peroxidase [Fimbriiglobus sp.]
MADHILDQKNVDPVSADVAPVLEQLQGNILKGHGRDHTVHLFFRFTGAAAQNRELVKSLTAKVTSMTQQLADTAAAKAGDTTRTFCNLFLSAKGYKALGFTDTELAVAFPEPAGPILFQPQVKFVNGMAFHQTELSDPSPAGWEAGYATPAGGAVVDGMVLLANDSVPVLETAESDVRGNLNGKADVLVKETGFALFNADRTQNLEHFGYVDGRSQPTFLKADWERENTSLGGVVPWDPAEPLRRVLVPDALAPTADAAHSFGSYFVFRKLEQNVKGFKTKEQELATALGLVGPARELAGAYAVGRFEDGTPVAVRDTDGLNAPVPNNFTFSGPDGADPTGGKCPFHAHVRKMSPRGDTAGDPNNEVERSHRITRRGITYGIREVEPKDDPELDEMPEGGVGLLFMCFQANIDNQFAFMQRAWANNVNFVRPQAGLDPVIGQPVGAVPVVQKWPSPYGTPNGATFGFEAFVTMKGGEFFFCPSLPFLKSL